MKRVLIIDDEPDVVDLLAVHLGKLGSFKISTALDGPTGLRKAREESPTVIVLDIMLPGLSGFDVCRALRDDPATEQIPVIVVTARVDTADRIRGFELGAVDYVTKPFSPREVILRINTITRCFGSAVGEQEWTAGDVSVNPTRHEVYVGGRSVRLTAVEFKLLTHLIQRRGRIQSRDLLLNQVWEYSTMMTTRTVDAHVVRLRKKLGRAGDVIETVRSYGYRVRDLQSVSGPAQSRGTFGGLIASS